MSHPPVTEPLTDEWCADRHIAFGAGPHRPGSDDDRADAFGPVERVDAFVDLVERDAL
jgi:hypothetical protein